MKKICYQIRFRKIGLMVSEGILNAEFDDNRFLRAEAKLTLDTLKMVPVDDGVLMSFYEGSGNRKVFEKLIELSEFELPFNYQFEIAHESYQIETMEKLGEIIQLN